MLISKAYRELNKQLHAEQDHYGRSSRQWVPFIGRIFNEEGHASILDYGCGKGEIKQALPELPIAEYDPAIEGKEAPPEPADLVLCTDVLEHIEPVHLNAVLRDLRRVTKRKALFVISCIPSKKTLADGRNAHLIVENADWWRKKLAREFRIAFVEAKGGAVFIEAFPRTATRPDNIQPPVRRRPLSKDWLDKFDEIRRLSAASADVFSRIESIRMFESVDDESADMQIICNMLEVVDDIDAAIRRAILHTRKSLMVTLDIPASDAPMWRSVFDRHLTIADWHVEERGTIMMGSPSIHVQGLKPIGVVASDERFVQVKASIARVSKRIEVAPAHGKRAILVCYGPSLAKNLKTLKQEAAEIDSAVISVSGAHDFLIENGIRPHIHVECDPRAHKTDNLNNPQAGTVYYIASVCHESLIDRLINHDLRLWHVHDGSHQERLLGELGEHPHTSITGGGSVGLRAIPLLYALGYRDFSIYGMDCSFEVNDETSAALLAIPHNVGTPDWEKEALAILNDGGAQQWAGRHAGTKKEVVPCICAGQIFATAPILMTYATQFFEIAQRAGPDVKLRLYGEGLLQSMARLYSRLPMAA